MVTIIPQADLDALKEIGRVDLLERYLGLLTPYELFRPRADDPSEWDMQSAFVNATDKFAVCIGGNRCLAGESEIYDPVDDELKRVDGIVEPFHVIAWDGRHEVVAQSSQPFVKGTADLYRFTLSTGESFCATMQHRVLTVDGWQPLSRLAPSCACLPQSSSELCPSALRQDVARYSRTRSGSLSGCLTGRRLCDARLRRGAIVGPEFARQLDDVLERTQHNSSRDGRGNEQEYSRPCRLFARRASMDVYQPQGIPLDAFESHASCTPSTQDGRSPLECDAATWPLSRRMTAHPLRTSGAFSRPATQCGCAFPLGGIIGDTVHIVKAEFVRRDAFYDFHVPAWNNYKLAGVFHHNSGKTIAAAYKTAKYLRETRPFRERCPFWILGETFEMTTTICWDENLRNFLDADSILDISWYDKKRNLPSVVLLKHPDDPKRAGWSIEFKSYDQGVTLMQGRSIGGYWFNEEAPINLVQEVQVRCANYDAPGWADFTPIHTRDPIWQELYDDRPTGWNFYHLNLLKNKTKKIQAWAAHYLPSIPEDERETRRIGVFASYLGQVFKEFRRELHVIKRLPTPDDKPGRDWWRIRGVDFGYSTPFACLWVAFDAKTGRYYVYDEHFETNKLIGYHVAKIGTRQWDNNSPLCLQTFCDSSRPDLIQEMVNLGIYASPAQLAKEPGAIARRLSFLRSLMMPSPDDGKPRLFIHERCKNLIREIRSYHWALPLGKDLRKHDASKDIPVPYDDHAIDAMAYAIFSHAMGGGKPPQAIRDGWKPREGVQLRGLRR